MYGKHWFIVSLILLLVALVAAGCVVPQPTVETSVVEETEAAVEAEAAEAEAPAAVEPAEGVFLDVGEQVPITILINESPWYKGFERLAELYEEQTGNEVLLDATPWNGMLEKARNSVRDAESPHDILNIDAFVVSEFYAGGFLTPFKEIDPDFEFAPEVLAMNDTMCWNEEKQWRTCDGGEIMAFSPNGNVQFLYYRADLYEEAGLEPPETWDDVYKACEVLHNPPDLYCIAMGGERGSRIAVDFTSLFWGWGASILKDPGNGDFTVMINSPEAKEALDTYVDLASNWGPPDYGSLSQSQVLQYMLTGKAAHVVPLATAAWAQMDNPEQSEVVDKVNVVVNPRPADGEHSSILGNWLMAIPQNLPDDRKQAAIAFAKWFLTPEAQYEYAKFGGVPVRSDTYESDLADQHEFRWFKAYEDSIPWMRTYLGYEEGPQVVEILGLRLNQALIGEMSTAEALNSAAEEIHQVLQESGRQTGMLEPLPEE